MCSKPTSTMGYVMRPVFTLFYILTCLTFFTNSVSVKNGSPSEELDDREIRRVECLAKLLCEVGRIGVNQERRAQILENFFQNDNANSRQESVEALQDYYVSAEELHAHNQKSASRSLISDEESLLTNITDTEPKNERISRAIKILENFNLRDKKPKLHKADDCDIDHCHIAAGQLMEKFDNPNDQIAVPKYEQVTDKNTNANQGWFKPSPAHRFYTNSPYRNDGGFYQTVVTPSANNQRHILHIPHDSYNDYDDNDTYDDEASGQDLPQNGPGPGGLQLKGDNAEMKEKQLWDFRPRPPPPPPPFWEVKRPENFWEKPEPQCGGGKKGKKCRKGKGKGKGKGKKGRGKKGKGKKGKKGGGGGPTSSEEEEHRFYRRLHYFLAEQKRIDAHKASLSWRIGGRPMALDGYDNVPIKMSLSNPSVSDIAKPISTAFNSLSRIFGPHGYTEHRDVLGNFWRQG